MKIHHTVFIIGSILFFSLNSSCTKKCEDKLSPYLEKIPYNNLNVVSYYNDTLGKSTDTVYVDKPNMDDLRYSKGMSESMYEGECYASASVTYSTNKFAYYFIQHDNEGTISIEVDCRCNFTKIDSQYVFNNETVDATYLMLENENLEEWDENIWLHSFMNEDSSFVYGDFVVVDSPYYKLLEYSTIYKDGTRRKWKLQE